MDREGESLEEEMGLICTTAGSGLLSLRNTNFVHSQISLVARVQVISLTVEELKKEMYDMRLHTFSPLSAN